MNKNTDEISALTTGRPSRKGRVKISSTVVAVARTLANRDYRSAELAFELKLPDDEFWRVREWCRRGLPHTRDATGHLLVNGHIFNTWVTAQSRRRNRRQLPTGHMWCLTCGAPQLATDVVDLLIKHRMTRIGTCPCGHRMSQWVSGREVV